MGLKDLLHGGLIFFFLIGLITTMNLIAKNSDNIFNGKKFVTKFILPRINVIFLTISFAGTISILVVLGLMFPNE